MSRDVLVRASRTRFMVGKYEVIAQPILGSAQMLRYTVLVNGKRIGALASMPTESDCRFLEDPPPVPPVKPFQIYYRPGRPKKGTPAAATPDRGPAPMLEDLAEAIHLPASDKMTAPRYQDIPAERIPRVTRKDGVSLRIIAGTVDGVEGAVRGIATSPLYLDVGVPESKKVAQAIPATHNALAYVFEGEGVIGGKLVGEGQLAVLSRGESEKVELVTTERAMRLILVAARPLDEPVARYGPFVMNTREEIHRAFEDYQKGTFLA